jgi:hypothetical protein
MVVMGLWETGDIWILDRLRKYIRLDLIGSVVKSGVMLWSEAYDLFSTHAQVRIQAWASALLFFSGLAQKKRELGKNHQNLHG